MPIGKNVNQQSCSVVYNLEILCVQPVCPVQVCLFFVYKQTVSTHKASRDSVFESLVILSLFLF